MQFNAFHVALANLFRWSNVRAFFVPSLATDQARDTMRLYKRVRRAYARSEYSDVQAPATFTNQLLDEAFRRLRRTPSSAVRSALYDFVSQLLDQELAIFGMPPLPQSREMSALALQDLRRLLLVKERTLANPSRYVALWSETVIRLILAATEHFPPFAFSQTTTATYRVALIDVCDNTPKTIETTVATLYEDNLIAAGFFDAVRTRLDDNLCRVSGVTKHEAAQSARKLVYPTEIKGSTPRDIVNAYLSGTPFAALFSIQIPFHIPPARWFEGTWIVAAQGRGKSNLLRHLILTHHHDASIIVLDAKGDLLKSFQRLAPIKDRLVIIEPDLNYPPAINPLDMGGNSAEFLAYLFAALDVTMTPSQTTLFRMVALLIQQIPNATLETFRDILQNGWQPYEQYVRKLKPRDQDFFTKELNTKTYSERKPEVLLRLRLLLSNPYIDAMFQSVKTHFDFGQMMDRGKIILVNNSYDPDKLGEEGSEFFGRVIVAMVWAAARRRANRPDHEKRPVYFFLDEAHCVIQRDATIAKIIQQCRSQNVAMIFAHQEIQQIKNEDVKNALTNCAVKFANSTGEAHELAPRLQTSPEFIKNQRQGTFACFVLDQTNSAVSIAVPLVPVREDHSLIDYPVIPRGEFDALMRAMHARYCQRIEPQSDSPADRQQDSATPDDDPATPSVDSDEKDDW